MGIYKTYDSAANAFIQGFDGKIESIPLLQVFTQQIHNSSIKFDMYGFGSIDDEDYGYYVVCELLNPRILLNVLASKLYDLNYYNNFDIVENIPTKHTIQAHNTYLKCSRY